MKALLALAISSLILLPAQDKVKIEPKFTAGQKMKYKLAMNFKLSQGEATVSSDVTSNVKSTDDKETTLEYTWTDTKVAVGGQEMTPGNEPYTVKVGPAGELLAVSGGMEGTDGLRTYILMHPHLPKEELAKDGTWTATIAKDSKLDIGERKIEGSYLGPEEVAGKKTLKLKIKMTETGTKFMTNLTCWVTSDGQMVKIDGDFAGLNVPVASDEAEGHVKAELIP